MFQNTGMASLTPLTLNAPIEKHQPAVATSQILDMALNELNCETMKENLKSMSGKYQEQYASAGYPPKICATMLKEICERNRLQT